MFRLLTRRPPVTLLVAIVAVALAASGSAVAASLVTSKQIKNGTIQLKDLSKKARAKLRGNQGPQGEPGPQGAPGQQGTPGQPGTQGEPGADAVSLHALINGDPTASVLHGNATAVNRTGAGRYEIAFGRDLAGCTANAIIAENTPHAGAQAVTGPDSTFGSVTDDEVLVVTYSLDVADGVSETDTDFYIQVFC